MSATTTTNESGGDHRRRAARAAIALAACGSLVLSACGGGDGGGATSTIASTTTTPTVTNTAAPDATESPSTTAALEEFEYVTDGATVLVANASRVNGAAGVATERLAAVGYTTADATNSSADVENLETTQIFYVAGDDAAAAVADNLRLAFGGGAITVEEVPDPAPTESGDIGDATVLVLLGSDTAGQTLESLRSPSAAADDAATEDAAETDTESDADSEDTTP